MSGSLPCFSHISASRDVDYLGITLPIFLFRSIDPSVLSNLMTLGLECLPGVLQRANLHSAHRRNCGPRWFFSISRSIFTRDNSVRRRLISICSALTVGVAELFKVLPNFVWMTKACPFKTAFASSMREHPAAQELEPGASSSSKSD